MNVNDKVSMEYEARVMIDEKQYDSIKSFYLNKKEPKKIFTNKNTYFDDEDLYLTYHHMVLRIRQIDEDKKELTLKIKEKDGDIEITSDKYDSLLKGKLDDLEMIEALKLRGADPSKLKIVTTLITERIEIPYDNYLLVIDKNYYNDKVDYNIEVESSSREEAEKYLLEIIKPFNVKYKKDYISKSRRAILKL